MYVLVVMAGVTAVILVGVVVVAVGRGGEMAYFSSDYAPLDLGAVAATDVVLLRPPTSIWGYNIQATDEALGRITDALSQRDIRIASLEQQVADLRAGRETRTAGESVPWPGQAAGPARWEEGATEWEAAGGRRPGLPRRTARGATPVTRPHPAVGAEDAAGSGPPEASTDGDAGADAAGSAPRSPGRTDEGGGERP